jgi:hypothetical protein
MNSNTCSLCGASGIMLTVTENETRICRDTKSCQIQQSISEHSPMTETVNAGTVTEVSHSPYTCYGSKTHCHWHEIDEPCPEPFRICSECGHVYKTANELESVFNTMIPGARHIPVTEISGCAYCGHDW